ncbi:jg7842 [Pararge aegeria aegeria]|uniref:Jg7842 protein n=1 Tax=Pararge aegeria aegeria TaxID=348720 RepID=A0A8S4RKC3_9NEOP|nr:jg7842 [Pararge aegeria aegeria]
MQVTRIATCRPVPRNMYSGTSPDEPCHKNLYYSNKFLYEMRLYPVVGYGYSTGSEHPVGQFSWRWTMERGRSAVVGGRNKEDAFTLRLHEVLD